MGFKVAIHTIWHKKKTLENGLQRGDTYGLLLREIIQQSLQARCL